MKIIYIITSLANAHGVERTFVDKANYLAEHGHDVIMVTYEQGAHEYAYPISPYVKYFDLNCRFFTIYKYSLPRRLFKAYEMRRRFRDRIRALVDDEKPDVFIASTYEGDYMKSIVALRHRTRIILESHTAFVAHMRGDNLLDKIRRHFLLKSIMRCDMMIALTSQDEKYWQRYINNVRVVPNPLTYYPEKIDCERKEKYRIIAVGSLHHVKRFDRLIDAFSLIADRFPHWYVDIYGDGHDRTKLTERIEKRGLVGRINLKGVTQDVFSEYCRSQFFVLSSDNEGFGLVIIEAMSCALPVVSTNCPFGPVDIIEDNVTGLLSKIEVKDLSEKMEWMMTHEKEREEMGRRARIAAARYKKERIMKEWEEAYRAVL